MSVGLHNKRIDLIRGISILLVLMHHFNIAYRLNDTLLAWAIGWNVLRAIVRNGNYGVTMFFVVSGFLITSNAYGRWSGLANISMWTFYGLRAARILPCLILLLVVVNVLALSGITIFQNQPEGGGTIPLWLTDVAALTAWMNVLIVHVGWFNYPLGVLWSLSVEETFYFSFPLICLGLRHEAYLVTFWVAIIIVGPLYRLTHQGDEGGYLYSYLASFDGIAIGCCTALLVRRAPLRWVAGRLFQASTVGAMTFLYLFQPIELSNVFGVTFMALGTSVLLAGAHKHPFGPTLVRSRLLASPGWFGTLSYELYLFHLIVLGAMRTALPPRMVFGDVKLLLLITYLVLSTVLSLSIARFFADPMNRGIRGRFARYSWWRVPGG